MNSRNASLGLTFGLDGVLALCSPVSEMVSADLVGTGQHIRPGRQTSALSAVAGMRRREVETSLPCVKTAMAVAATK